MTKLIIQIPCYNEEATLGITLAQLPRQLPGIDTIEWLVIDDGSTDRTIEVACTAGVDHIVRFHRHCGLATAFVKGLEAALAAGADIIVNTDADNQYRAEDIPRLIEPVVHDQADIVIGERNLRQIDHYSLTRRVLHRIGNWVVRLVSRTEIRDAPSGFRAISREAALRINIFSKYTYTLEMLIQAGVQGLAVRSVPVGTNPVQRPSRLMRSPGMYVWQSALTIIRIFLTYKPLVFCLGLGMLPMGISLGFGLATWFRLPALSGLNGLLATLFFALVGLQCWVLGLAANLLAVNRRLLEELLVRERRAAIQPVGTQVRDISPQTVRDPEVSLN